MDFCWHLLFVNLLPPVKTKHSPHACAKGQNWKTTPSLTQTTECFINAVMVTNRSSGIFAARFLVVHVFAGLLSDAGMAATLVASVDLAADLGHLLLHKGVYEGSPFMVSPTHVAEIPGCSPDMNVQSQVGVVSLCVSVWKPARANVAVWDIRLRSLPVYEDLVFLIAPGDAHRFFAGVVVELVIDDDVEHEVALAKKTLGCTARELLIFVPIFVGDQNHDSSDSGPVAQCHAPVLVFQVRGVLDCQVAVFFAAVVQQLCGRHFHALILFVHGHVVFTHVVPDGRCSRLAVLRHLCSTKSENREHVWLSGCVSYSTNLQLFVEFLDHFRNPLGLIGHAAGFVHHENNVCGGEACWTVHGKNAVGQRAVVLEKTVTAFCSETKKKKPKWKKRETGQKSCLLGKFFLHTAICIHNCSCGEIIDCGPKPINCYPHLAGDIQCLRLLV